MMEALFESAQLDLFAEPAPQPDAVKAETRQLQARYDALAVAFGLPPSRVVLSARRATGGVIQYGPPHTIRISLHMSPEDRLQTLLHETAHEDEPRRAPLPFARGAQARAAERLLARPLRGASRAAVRVARVQRADRAEALRLGRALPLDAEAPRDRPETP